MSGLKYLTLIICRQPSLPPSKDLVFYFDLGEIMESGSKHYIDSSVILIVNSDKREGCVVAQEREYEGRPYIDLRKVSKVINPATSAPQKDNGLERIIFTKKGICLGLEDMQCVKNYLNRTELLNTQQQSITTGAANTKTQFSSN